ncbi:hypothetical protein OV208_03125 [Corallococcus sp. bb12-1]|uniref:hypothetical protein n=1 Tax=Corallococcus sp. bb12-1 TaxID=2996784 RepID=UPI00226ECAB4|nr:hypothetical protein [Corallococcus sp. bb12-1]MCY1040301.1 hypothetical protein [Corallococcus sp. bb12-1]
MSLRRNLLTVALLSTALLSACSLSLRPRYKDLVQTSGTQLTEDQLVVLRVTDSATGEPVKGAKVSGGEYRNRLNAVSDANGEVSLKVNQALLAENPLVEVVLPKGVHHYKLKLVPSGEAPASEGAPVVAPPSIPNEPTSPAAPTAPAAPVAPGSPTETPIQPAPASGT